jgi:hypothetical protein
LTFKIELEQRQGVHARFREQSRIYFAQMGIDPVFADMIEANYGIARNTQLSRADGVRFRIVTDPSPTQP